MKNELKMPKRFIFRNRVVPLDTKSTRSAKLDAIEMKKNLFLPLVIQVGFVARAFPVSALALVRR